MKKASVLAVVIIFLLCHLYQNAQDFTWKKTSIPSVGIKELKQVEFRSVLFILTTDNKLYRLWYDFSSEYESVMDITPDSIQIEFTSILADEILQFVGTNKNGIYIYSYGLLREHILSGLEDVHITALCCPYNILAGSTNGLYKSTSHGEIWSKLDNQLNNLEIVALGGPIGSLNQNYTKLFASTRDSGVYESFDKGFTFQKSDFPLSQNEFIKSFYDNYDTLYAISNNNIFYYDIYGDTTWKIFNNLPASDQITSLIFYNYDSSTVLKSNNENSIQKYTIYNKMMIGTYDKGIMNLENNYWIEKNDSLKDIRIISLISDHSYYPITGNIFGGTASDGVYRLQLKLLPDPFIVFEDNNSPDFTIINNNDQLVKLRLNLTNNDYVNLELYDLQGNKVKDVYKDYLSEGTHILDLDIGDLQSGIYFIKLQLSGKTTLKKMLVAR